MGRTSDAFWRNWCIWVVLFFAGGIKALVNSIEQPFARSLVSCDVPVEPGTYTGSRWCGDRLRVIQLGLELSALGQSQENVSMLLLLPFVVISTSIWGPKLSMMVGLMGVITSVVLFLVAASSLAWARVLFASGQFFQGTFPIEYLTSILFLLMSLQPDNDPQANMQLMTYHGFLAGAIFNSGLGDIAQMAEVADYTGVWIFLLVLNIIILLLVIFAMPTSRPLVRKEGEPENPVARLFHEVMSYKTLFESWIVRRLGVKCILEALIPPFQGKVAGAQMMAYHGWSQKDLTGVLMLPQLIGLKCFARFGELSLRFGQHFMYTTVLRFGFVHLIISAFTLPFTHRWYLGGMYTMAIFSGFLADKYHMEMRYVDPEQMVRFQNVQWLLNYFLGIWAGPMYVALFDATAETYSGRVVPGLLCTGVTVLLYLLQFYGLYDLDGVHGWGVALRTRDLGGDKALELWNTIAYGPGPGIGRIGQEKFAEYKLQEFLGLKLGDVGGSIDTLEQWLVLITAMNSTNAQGLETLEKLHRALGHAWSQWPEDERHRLSFRLWTHLSAHGELSEALWTKYRLKELLGLPWEDAGGSATTLEQLDASLDSLPEGVIIERLQRSVAHADKLLAKHLHSQKKAQESNVKAPNRQKFLARGGQLGMFLHISEVVIVGIDPGKDIVHVFLGLALWLVARKKTRVGSFRAVLACILSLWLGGAGASTGFGFRPHILNVVWLSHILIFCLFGVMRYFFEVDMDDKKEKKA